jgi:hypothetical protein
VVLEYPRKIRLADGFQASHLAQTDGRGVVKRVNARDSYSSDTTPMCIQIVT